MGPPPQQDTARIARTPPGNSHRHAALHAALEREGRALPSDDGARVGQGSPIQEQHRPQPSPATLARLLQHAQAPLSPRWQAPNHPRSQPPQARQLVVARSVFDASVVAAWLNDPKADATDRVKRGLCEQLYSAMELVRLRL